MVVVWLLLVLVISQAVAVQGQEANEELLSIRFRRNFGYGLGSQMQGKFTIRVEGPQDVARVEFLLDGNVIGEDSEAPFSLAVDTADYPEGIHRFSAVGYKANGDQVGSETISRQFVSTSVVTIVVIAIVVLVILFRIASYFLARRSGSKQAGYGFLGGAVCSNCGRPFGIHWWSLRLGVGRFDRCPHCGKWKMVRRASPEALAAAEAMDRPGESTAQGGENDEEAFRRRLEESRYDHSDRDGA